MRWKHDCDKCISLGEYLDHDLYFCTQGSLNMPTVLARYGNEDSEYLSGLEASKFNEFLREAKKRAEARELI